MSGSVTAPRTPAGWSAARAVLAVRLDGMGDMLMTTPALRALKEAVPGRRLTVLASPAGARIARALPFVDDVLEFAAPWMKHPGRADAARRTDALISELRTRRFEAAVIFTVFSQSALPAALALMLADIPLRAAHCRENPYELLTEWIAEQDLDVRAGVRHEVARQLDLVAALGAVPADTRLQFPVSDAASAALARKLAVARVQPPYVAVHPGATAPSRRYPLAQLAEAVSALVQDHGYTVVAMGGEEDRAAAQALCQAGAAVSLAGELALDELGAALAGATVVIANNSLAAHLAAAVGTPVCDLYALTNPQHTPWRVAHRVLNHDVGCRNCFKSVCPERHHRCLAAVAPAEVVRAVRELATECVSRRAGGAAASPVLFLAA
jgi:lipopolysaccharide heptosyltransferase II